MSASLMSGSSLSVAREKDTRSDSRDLGNLFADLHMSTMYYPFFSCILAFAYYVVCIFWYRPFLATLPEGLDGTTTSLERRLPARIDR